MPHNYRDRVLVIGDDMRIFLAVVRSLGRAGKEIHAAPFDWRSPALCSKYVSTVHYFPRYSDDPEAWREAVLSVLRNHSIDLVIPCCDRAILPLHLHRPQFADYRIAIPNSGAMDLLFDKGRTRELSRDLGIPVSPGRRLRPSDNAPGLIASFGLPLVVKPRKSYWLDRLDAWGKVWILERVEELEELLKSLQDHHRYLVEAYFQGVGVGVSVLSLEGKLQHAFQHRRLREGRGGSSSYRVSEPVNPDLYCACEKICRHTNLTGVCMFEFRLNPSDKTWILIETNARFWGSVSLPISLGVDFPRFLFDLMMHKIQHQPVKYPVGVRSRNLVLDGYNLISRAHKLHWNESRAWLFALADFLAQPLYLMIGRERSDTFVRDDLRPAFWECAGLVRSLARKLIRHRSQGLHRRHSEQPTS